MIFVHLLKVQLEKSKLNLLTGWTKTKQVTKYMSSDPGWTQNVLKYSPMSYITHAHKSIVNKKIQQTSVSTQGALVTSHCSPAWSWWNGQTRKWAATISFFFMLLDVYIYILYTFPKRIFFPWEFFYWHMEMAAVTFLFPVYLNPFSINDISSMTDALPSLLMSSTMSVWGALSLPQVL